MTGPRSKAPTSTAVTLAVLFAVNIFSVMDRTIFSITAPSIAAELDLSDSQIGALAGLLFSVFYAVCGIPIARLADKGNRGLVVSLSLLAWSAVTVLTGFAQSFLQLAFARIGVAVGEAGATPAAHSILAERFPLGRRAAAMAIHSAGAPVGAFLGLAIGGFLASEVGWRWTFVILGAPGALLAAGVWLLLDESRRPRPAAAASHSLKSDLGELFGIPAYRWLLCGFAVGAFIISGLTQWLPSHFIRTFEASPREVGAAFGLAYGLGSATGMLVGGWLTFHLVKRTPRWTMWMASLSYLVAAPLGAMALMASNSQAAYISIGLMSAASTVAYGPVFALIQELAPARLRSLASAAALFCASFLGAGLGPLAVGMLSDTLGGLDAERLRVSLLVLLSFSPIPALLYLLSARSMKIAARGS